MKLASIHGEPAVELCGADPYKSAELRELGLLNEQINWRQRFFIPTDVDKGIAILAELLTRYPVITAESDSEEAEPTQTVPAAAPAQTLPEVTVAETGPEAACTYNSNLNIVDVQSWVIDVPEYRTEPGQMPADEVLASESQGQEATEPGAEIWPDTEAESCAVTAPQQESQEQPAGAPAISQ